MMWSPATRRYGLVLGISIVIIGCGHVLLHLFEPALEARFGKNVTRWLDMNAETSVATWFSVGLFQITAFVAVLAAVGARHHRERVAWAALAVAVFLLSLDDKIMFHEALPDLLGMDRGGLFTHEWLIPGAVIAVLVLIALLILLRPLPRSVRLGLMVAAAIFASGAVGVEFLSGMINRGLERDHILVRLFPLWELIEETLEKVGTALGFLVVLRHLEVAGIYDPDRWRSLSR